MRKMTGKREKVQDFEKRYARLNPTLVATVRSKDTVVPKVVRRKYSSKRYVYYWLRIHGAWMLFVGSRSRKVKF